MFQACKHLYIYSQDFYTNLEVESLDSNLDKSNKELELELEDNHPLANFELFTH